MKNFEELTEEEQNEVILNISSKLDNQEIWYWEGLVHKLREYENFFDSDMEIRKGLVDRIKRQEKEIAELEAKLEMYENGVYFSNENDELQARIDKAIEYIDKELSFNVIINGKENKVIAYNKAFENIRNILESSDEQ